MSNTVSTLVYDEDQGVYAQLFELAFSLMTPGAPMEIATATLEPGQIPDPVRRYLLRERPVSAPAPVPGLETLHHQSFDLVIRLHRQGQTAFPEEEDPRAVDKRPLLVGDPIHLRWALPEAAPGESTWSPDHLQRVINSMQQQLDALACGYLEALQGQRQRIHRILDTLSEGIIAHDEFRCISLFNQAAEALTGYSRKEVLGRDCHDVFGKEGICGNGCLFRGTNERVTERQEYYTTFTTRDGEDRRLRMDVRPMPLGAGRLYGVMASIDDVTEVNDLRWQLRRGSPFHGTVGNSRAMQEIFTTIRQVASSDYSVLVAGESGTGKELAARAIHAESRRSKGPFVPINCGALPENILESELFGHVRGAFTGAIRDKKGRFELANRGTLFLDEVGELTPAFQVKLLRVLQEKRFEMVGGERSYAADVRIIAATNRDLRQMVAKGDFREDLFYRLCVVPLTLPPLRERVEDLPLLVEHFLGTIREETGKDIQRVSAGALENLLRHRWPGNIRELINALQFAAVRCQGDEVMPHHLPPEVRDFEGEPMPLVQTTPPATATATELAPAPATKQGRFKLNLEAVEQALQQTGGNKVKAAKLLGVGRATLYRFLSRNPIS